MILDADSLGSFTKGGYYPHEALVLEMLSDYGAVHMKPVAQWGTNWTGSAGTAAANYKAGVQGTTKDWASLTVAAQGLMQQEWLAALPTWASHVQATGTGGWKTATVDKANNYITGFTAGAPNYNTAAQKIYNALNSIVPSLPPRGTYEQNLNRLTTELNALHALKGTLGAK